MPLFLLTAPIMSYFAPRGRILEDGLNFTG